MVDPGDLVQNGPLIVALGVAALAGVVSFLSPCCLPLVPGYLSLTAGTVGDQVGAATDDTGDLKERVAISRTVCAGVLFVLGFAAVFVSYGAAFGGLGAVIGTHQQLLTRVLGVLTIVMGLVFMGATQRLPFLQRTFRVPYQPKLGLIGAPILGVLFGLGWTPCIGPTLAAVLTLSLDQANAARGALLGLAYSFGLGLPFIIAGVLFQRGMAGFGWARRRARGVMIFGGAMLVVIGVLQVTGGWNQIMIETRSWVSGFQTRL